MATTTTSCRKYKGLFGLPYSQKEKTAENLPLDKVDSDLVGALKIEKLKELCASNNILNFIWIVQLFDILNPATITGWCGWTGDGLGDHCKSDIKFHHQFVQSCETNFDISKKKTVFIHVKVCNYMNRIFHRFFTVPKGNGIVARIITSCKGINKYCKKCEFLRFPSIGDLFRILAFFRDPCMATSDFRHWFFQIPLPAIARKLFSVHSGDMVGEIQAWPMGFSWSPFTAQSTSMCICAIAILNCGLFPYFPDHEKLLPPFWIIKNHIGAVVAFIIIWYDNILIVAGNKRVRENLVNQLTFVGEQIHAIWKVDSPESKPFKESQNTVDFIGMSFTTQSGTVSWTHLESNRKRWTTSMISKKQHSKLLTWRDISEILGICIWDWWVSGNNRSQIKLVLKTAQATGKLCAIASDWDKISTVKPEDTLTLINMVIDLAEDATPKRREMSNATQSNSFTEGIVVIACSDAMAIRGAGITFTPEGKEINHSLYVWNDDEIPQSINWRETSATIRTVLWIVANNPRCAQILLGVDNSTAFAALSRHIFATDEELQQELDNMFLVLDAKNISLFPCQIPGIILAADEPSRGLKALKHKMVECAKLLLAPRDASWWESLKKRSRGSL